jgi:XTP/dITP diphosphohydrolase
MLDDVTVGHRAEVTSFVRNATKGGQLRRAGKGARKETQMKSITVVTGNSKKAKEIEAITGVSVKRVGLDIKEIQSLSVREVAREKALVAYRELRVPVLVDDTGMSITALGGLPGALVSWFLNTIGPEGILRLMRESEDRRASVSTCIAYCEGAEVHLFEGEINGTISVEMRGTNGFGYDPIFIPSGQLKTYAEMTPEEKNTVSMRGIALSKLRHFVLQQKG